MKLPRWVSNIKAGVSPAQVILLAVSFLLVAILVPIAMTTTGYLSTTTNWNAAVVTIFVTVVPILFIIGVSIKFIPSGKGGEYIQTPKRLLNSIKADVSPAAIIIMAIGFLLLGILTPIAMTQIITACSTTWGTATFTIFTVLLPILFLVGVAIRFIPKGGE
jgi:small-conductance mechanosensitive channel